MLYINKCYHTNGTEMDKDFKLKITDKAAEELLDFLSKTTTYSQNFEGKIRNTA